MLEAAALGGQGGAVSSSAVISSCSAV